MFAQNSMQMMVPASYQVFPAGVHDGFYDIPHCFDSFYHNHNSGTPQNMFTDSDVDFNNFPWLPDFDHYTALNQYQLASNNKCNTYNHGSVSTSSNSSAIGASDSCSDLSSGGELEILGEKSLKRKSDDLRNDAVGEGDLDRRERNRLNAKKARLRKKQLLGTLQEQLALLQGENAKLRRVIAARIPEKSVVLLNKSSQLAELLSGIANAQ